MSDNNPLAASSQAPQHADPTPAAAEPGEGERPTGLLPKHLDIALAMVRAYAEAGVYEALAYERLDQGQRAAIAAYREHGIPIPVIADLIGVAPEGITRWLEEETRP